ncbi:hypothetical protein A3844_04310 [Paenibacillus helianthi]|uniref:ATP-grasp domain-containing protein n=1 Tax=Paenibacillus helianthi TaxID=1349432 RepID=A0ABX3ET06_9BACL|nr:ATP-grasp domain-containing protein [Paenibacillus helianthi]OKP91071.1 hypothetical protein A3844_04310 [Paenibacillus helianthi]
MGIRNTEMKHILYVEDRPMLLTQWLLNSEYIVPVLLRFQHCRDAFSEEYLKKTEHENLVFWVNIMNPIESEAQRFQRWQISKGVRVEYFLNPSEVAQYFSQSFARYLELPCLTEEQTICSRNKARMKDKLREIGFKTANYREICNVEELIEAGHEMGWPIVLKPVDDSSCRDTFVLKSPEEAKKIYMHSKYQWLAEEYINMMEFALDVLIFDSKAIAYYPLMYPAQLIKTLDGEINASITMRHYSTAIKDKAEYIINKYIQGMNITHGYVHIEYFADPAHKQIVLGEVGLRLSGSQIPVIHGLSYGINLFDTLIKIHIGEYPVLDYIENRFVGELLLPVKQGKVKEISTLNELIQMEGVIDGVLIVTEGQTVQPERASMSGSGYLLVEGQSVDQVHQRMLNILLNFKFILETDSK